ncbi:hypothetical protein [Bradyrhizobium barranii]
MSMLKAQEQQVLAAVMAAHLKMTDFEAAARIASRNAEEVARLLRANDSNGYLSEILRAGRQASVVTELAREAHDALVDVLNLVGKAETDRLARAVAGAAKDTIAAIRGGANG